MNKLILIIIFVVVNNCCLVKPNAEQSKQKHIEQIVNEKVAEFITQPEFSALSGAVYVDGKSYQFHFGRLVNGKQANNQTIYEIGSITKTYTGLLLSQAVFDKKVTLEDDIRIYLDENYLNLVLDSGKPITLRHLITHTSGLPLLINCDDDLTIDENISCFESFTRDDFFNELKRVTLSDRSGTKYQYSGVGTQLVGYILEEVYQQSFQELFEKYVFSRCGEQNIFSELRSDGNSNLSIGNDISGIPMPLINGFYKYSGGAKSTTESMLNYIKMYLKNNDPVVKQAMNLLTENKQFGRAYAWNTYNYDQNKKMLYHNGSTFGHSSWIALYPNQKTGIFLVTNVLTDNSQGDLNELSNKIIDLLIE